MNTKRAIAALLGVASLFAGASPVFADPTCASLENKKSESRLEFLQGEKARLDGNCVLYAIDQLGRAQYAPAVPTLLRYLDYPYPDPPNYGTPQNPLILAKINWTNYPAANALSDIGKVAVPQLVEAIADAATPELIRKNAADTERFIYAPDPPEGIAVLVRAAHARTDPMDSLRLMDQARRLASLCRPEVRNECENASLK